MNPGVQRKSGLSIWLDGLAKLLVEELAPRPRRFRSSLRWTTIATIGVGLMAACHVRSVLGPYIVFLMLGPVPMMSPRTGLFYLAGVAPLLAASVPLAGILVETPWLLLPFIGTFVALSTYISVTRKLGPIGLVSQVITLDAFYGATFAPDDFGWSNAAVFGGFAIAMALIAAFDTWLWPDPAEAILLESLAGSLGRQRERFVQTTAYYLNEPGAARPAEPPVVSETPMQVDLLNRAVVEGVSVHRRAVLLAAITAIERLHLQVSYLMIAARETVAQGVRTMVRPELQTVCGAIADTYEELAREVRSEIRTGLDLPPGPVAARVRPAMDALSARVAAVRPVYIGSASAAEIANFGDFTEGLNGIVRLVERPLDEPPAVPVPAAATAAPASQPDPAPASPPDPALVPYCLKVALCVVIGYVIGLVTHRADLSTILTTIIVAALPTYGATLRKMRLRIIGAVLGGAVALLAIIIATPNFDTLPSYMLVTFVVVFISFYASLSSGRVAYAGKQLGTTFLLVFGGLSPAPDIYSPLWRTWGILLGTVVVTVIFLILSPVYAGDSLLPRLRKVIGDTLSIIPGAARTIGEINRIDNEITAVLSEIMQVADDARMEGRRSLIDHDAVVEAAGTIRRIANRLATLSVRRLIDPLPRLDDATEAAADAAFAAIQKRLESWLAFYQGPESLSARRTNALAGGHARNEIAQPVEDFTNRIEEGQFARIAAWSLEQRRRMLAELQSLRRLDFLMSELETYLSGIPGDAPAAETGYGVVAVGGGPA
ncbi:MAG TPA: FUSC family protein [Candidatus Binataceae bacterium]